MEVCLCSLSDKNYNYVNLDRLLVCVCVGGGGGAKVILASLQNYCGEGGGGTGLLGPC